LLRVVHGCAREHKLQTLGIFCIVHTTSSRIWHQIFSILRIISSSLLSTVRLAFVWIGSVYCVRRLLLLPTVLKRSAHPAGRWSLFSETKSFIVPSGCAPSTWNINGVHTSYRRTRQKYQGTCGGPYVLRATQGCTFETSFGVGGLDGQQKSLLCQCGLAGGVERDGADNHQYDKKVRTRTDLFRERAPNIASRSWAAKI
jgi:hypothetical protein